MALDGKHIASIVRPRDRAAAQWRRHPHSEPCIPRHHLQRRRHGKRIVEPVVARDSGRCAFAS
jgi:hypothetical protein